MSYYPLAHGLFVNRRVILQKAINANEQSILKSVF